MLRYALFREKGDMTHNVEGDRVAMGCVRVEEVGCSATNARLIPMGLRDYVSWTHSSSW